MNALEFPTVLNVDDNEARRYAKSRILKRGGYQIIESETGAEALRVVKEFQPSLVLLDVKLPDTTGFAVCEAIKADPATAHIMVLQISAMYLSPEDRARGLERGADTYLTEPVEPAELLGATKALLRLYERDRDNRFLLDQLRDANHQNAAQLAELNSIYATAPVGLAVLDTDLRYLRVNDLLAVTNGKPAEQHIGRTVGEIIPSIAGTIETTCRELLVTGKPRLETEIIGETPAQPGVKRTWLHSYFPLKDLNGECIGINVAVQDLTEQKRLEERLREADKRKDEFLAVLGHEWRNPLGVISNAFELLPVSGTPESQEIRAIIKQQITRMTHLTNDLLDVSRISAGQIEIDKQSCDFAAIVREAAEDYRGILDSVGIRLELQLPKDQIWVLGDCRRLAQSVGNLLHNTNKFTPPGGTVTVTLGIVPNRQTAVLKVRDTGIGMDESTLARLFEPFSHALRSFDRRRGGLGLGLTLLKGFIEMHGGEVSASSKGSGTGSEFTVQLPVQRDPTGTSVASPESSASRSSDPISSRILIIDDNQVGARAMQLFLQDTGHLVEIAHSGVEAFVIARNLRPDVVLCDIALPWVDGYTIARTIRQDAELKNVYLVAISGYAQDEDQQLAKQSGFDEYCVKPVDLRFVDEMIKNRLRAPAR
jgi:signal transduction histidine kinase